MVGNLLLAVTGVKVTPMRVIMMKCNILAIVISALVAGVSAVNAVEIYNKDGNKLNLYGKVDVRHFFSKNNDNGDDSGGSLGVRGDAQISDQLAGFGRFELKTKTNKSEDNNQNISHLAYVGLKFTDFNSIDYGNNHSVLFDVNKWVDVLPLYGGDSMSQINNYLVGRNLLTYRGTDFFGLIDGLNFALQYQCKNIESNRPNDSKDILKNNNAGLGVAANYNTGWGIELGAGYTRSNRELTNQQKIDSGSIGNSAESWNAGIKYDANNLYLAAMYGETRNMIKYYAAGRVVDIDDSNNMVLIPQIASKTKNIEVVGQYQFNEINLKPSIAYVQSKGEDLTDLNNYNGLIDFSYQDSHQDLVKYISVGAFYYFNKNLTAVIDYKINLINDDSAGINANNKYGINNRDRHLVGLGLTYQI